MNNCTKGALYGSIKYKLTNTVQEKVQFTAYLSDEKKMKLLEELNKHHIDFDIFDLDE